MVKLNFVEYAPAPLSTVWEYFSKFENIAKWDPNTRRITAKTNKSEEVGSTYTLVTLWKGSESALDYHITQVQKHKKMSAQGQNSTTTVIDVIQFREKGEGTEILYEADISLRHVLKILTPFIRGDLEKLRDQAQAGMKAKIKELYG